MVRLGFPARKKGVPFLNVAIVSKREAPNEKWMTGGTTMTMATPRFVWSWVSPQFGPSATSDLIHGVDTWFVVHFSVFPGDSSYDVVTFSHWQIVTMASGDFCMVSSWEEWCHWSWRGSKTTWVICWIWPERSHNDFRGSQPISFSRDGIHGYFSRLN